MSAEKPMKAPVLLSGGNPQIAKGDGDGPVQAYITAMPDWKQSVGRSIDKIIEREVPGVAKKVRWNTPFYGVGDNTSFVAFHCMTRYIKVTFFKGTDLDPVPKETSKQPGIRYLHIHDPGVFDEDQFSAWIRQASALPGEKI